MMSIILRTFFLLLIFSNGLADDFKNKPGCPVNTKIGPGPCKDECKSDDDCKYLTNGICCNSGCSREGVQGFYNMCLVRDGCTMGYCKNNAVCTKGQLSDYTCRCLNGFTDKNCSTNIDDCEPDPCQNGGVCHDGVGDYHCCCPPGWSGKNCTQIDTCRLSGKTLGQELPFLEIRVPCPPNKCGLYPDIYCVVEVRYKRVDHDVVEDVTDKCLSP